MAPVYDVWLEFNNFGIDQNSQYLSDLHAPAVARLPHPVDDPVVQVPEDGEAVVRPVPALHRAVQLDRAAALHHDVPALRVVDAGVGLCNRNIVILILQCRKLL